MARYESLSRFAPRLGLRLPAYDAGECTAPRPAEIGRGTGQAPPRVARGGSPRGRPGPAPAGQRVDGAEIQAASVAVVATAPSDAAVASARAQVLRASAFDPTSQPAAPPAAVATIGTSARTKPSSTPVS